MNTTAYAPYPAQTYPNHPHWPVYEAPARWYIRPETKGKK